MACTFFNIFREFVTDFWIKTTKPIPPTPRQIKKAQSIADSGEEQKAAKPRISRVDKVMLQEIEELVE